MANQTMDFSEVVEAITNQYDCLSGDEVAEIANELFPDKNFTYEGDSIFTVEIP